MTSVGISPKPNSAPPHNPKFSFSIDMQKFEVNQTLFGEQKLNFNNMLNDPSSMREAISYKILRQFVPAEQTAYATVVLETELRMIELGVYLVVEQVDRYFLNKNFDSDARDLYKLALPAGTLQYTGEQFEDYAGVFPIEPEEQATDEAGASFVNFVDQLNHQTVALKLRRVLKIDDIIYVMAVLSTILDLNSPIGNGNNFYVYQSNPESGKFTLIPGESLDGFGGFTCDRDYQQLIDSNLFYPFCGSPDVEFGLARLLQIDEFRMQFRFAVKDIIRHYFNVDWISQEIHTLRSVIEPFVAADNNSAFTYQQFLCAISPPPPPPPVLSTRNLLPLSNTAQSNRQSPSNQTNPLPPSNNTNPLPPPSNGTNPLPPPTNSTNQLPPHSNSTNPLPPPTNGTNPLPPPSNSTNPLPPTNSTGFQQRPPNNESPLQLQLMSQPSHNNTIPPPSTNSTNPLPPSNSTNPLPPPPNNSTNPLPPPTNSTNPLPPPTNSTNPLPPHSNSTNPPPPPTNGTNPFPPRSNTTNPPTNPPNNESPLQLQLMSQPSHNNTIPPPSANSTNPLPPPTNSTNPLPPPTNSTNPLPPHSNSTNPLPPTTNGTNPLPPPTNSTTPPPPHSTSTNPLPPPTNVTNPLPPPTNST